ncbi:MAG: lactate racemase domain-containing protein, partial [Oscillospiraceae bacterium]|nr:lactate racemase domain-containing protein [Oscillospiraceae bacterium]
MKNRIVPMAWYRSKKELSIPEKNLIGVLEPDDIRPAEDLRALINRHLDHPVGCAPFDELCAGKKKICLLICDLSRPMQTDKVLPVVLERIKRASPDAQVSLLVAQGTHRALTREEKIYLCGQEVVENYPVLDHEFDNPEQLVCVQGAREDFPIYVNKLLYESDFKMAIGAVKPHPIFGWSGGAKIIIPGVSGKVTTGLSHWNSVTYKGTEIMGKVENPIRAEVEQAVRQEGLLDFILNAVLTDDSSIHDLRCGDFVQAHRACVAAASRYYYRDAEPADAVIVGVGKWGADLWVGSMGIYSAEFYLKKGGTIIALEACPEGVSAVHPEILQYGYRPYREIKPLVDS